MRTLLVATALLLAGCYTPRWARQEEFDALIQQQVGRDISDVMSTLGSPTKTTELPNGKMLYEWERYFGASVRGGTIYDAWGSSSSSSRTEMWCAFRFTVVANRVNEVHYSGPGCF